MKNIYNNKKNSYFLTLIVKPDGLYCFKDLNINMQTNQSVRKSQSKIQSIKAINGLLHFAAWKMPHTLVQR